jgi:hypothetical protein
MFYSGRVKSVAALLRNDIVKRLTKVECYSNRLVFVKISANPCDIMLVQVYIPTTNHHNDEKEKKCTTRSVRYCIKKEEFELKPQYGKFQQHCGRKSTN